MRAAVGLGLLASFLLAVPAPALDPRRAVSEYGQRIWSSREGLPQNTVRTLAEDAAGYLFLGTQAGRVRFNGVRFEILEGGSCFPLTIDAGSPSPPEKDALWYGCEQPASLVRQQGGRPTVWREEGGLPGVVTALARGDGGTLWIATSNGLRRLARQRLQSTGLGELAHDAVNALARGRDGALWIGTADRGLWRLAGGPPAVLASPLKSRIQALAVDRRGDLWVGTPAGLARLEDGRWRTWTAQDGLADDGVRALLADREGDLWIGTEGGLDRWDGQLEMLSPGQPRLPALNVDSLYEDAEGSLWVGTWNAGLLQLRDQVFSSPRLGEHPSAVWTIYEDRGGARWVGTQRGLFRLQDGRVTRLGRADGLPSDTVRTLIEDRRGDLWIGTRSGLCRRRGGRCLTYTTRDGLPNDAVLALFEDRDGSLWIGTAFHGGLAHLEDGRIAPWGADRGLPPQDVAAVYRDRAGTLWVGGGDGLFRQAGDGRFERYPPPPAAPDLTGVRIAGFREDADGTLWIGTQGAGFLRLRAGRLTPFRQSDGLPDDSALDILDDGRGRLWVASNRGIYHVLKADLAAFTPGRRQTLSAISFDDSDGMPHTECAGGNQPSALKARDGSLWFPTLLGVARFDPDREPGEHRPPPVAIEEVRVGEGGWSELRQPALRLAPGEKKVEIRYSALSLTAPERVRFRYKLSGFDRAWVDADAERSVVYTNLAPGNYTFRVRASNDHGVWNEAGASLGLTLPPRFYQISWFRALAAALLALAGYSAWRLRSRALRRHERELALLVDERTRDLAHEKARAEEANRTKSEFLASMSHEIRTPLNAVLGMTSVLLGMPLPGQERDCVETIRHSGESLLGLINDILDFSKIEAGAIELEITPFALEECIDGALEIAAPRAVERHLALSRRLAEDVPATIETDPTRLRQILVNLLDNAVKFTPAGRVELTVERVALAALAADEVELEFAVADTGIGISPTQMERLFKPFSQADATILRRYGGTGLGLAICLRLAERLGGRMWVESEPGHGSTFRFTLRCRAVAAGSAGEAPREAPTAAQLAPLPALRVLLAEDNPVNQKVMLLMIERLGILADVASDGVEVLEALSRQRYHVILMDVLMPRMDGIEATRRIRALDLRPWRQPHIVAVTANASAGDREACLAAGMDDFLSKPVSLVGLKSALLRATEPGPSDPGQSAPP